MVDYDVEIRGDLIELGQLVKLLDLAPSGGAVKDLLARGGFAVNGEADNRRGRKIRPGDVVTLPGGKKLRIIGSK